MCKCKNKCKKSASKARANSYFKEYLKDPKNKKKHYAAVKRCHENNPEAVQEARLRYETKMRIIRSANKIGYNVILKYDVVSFLMNNSSSFSYSKLSKGVYSVTYNTYKTIRKSNPGKRIEVLGIIKDGVNLK